MTTRTNYKSILALTEIYAGRALYSQVLEKTDWDYGGFRCPEKLVCEPWAARLDRNACSLLSNPGSQGVR